MIRIIKLVFIVFLIILSLSRCQNNLNNNDHIGRAAAGVIVEKECNELVFEFIRANSKVQVLSTVKHDSVFDKVKNQLKNLNYKLRLSLLELFASHHFFSNGANQRLAQLLNFAQENGLLNEHDLKRVIKKWLDSGLPPVSYSQGRFYASAESVLVSGEELVHLVSFLPPNLRNKMQFELLADGLDSNKLSITKKEFLAILDNASTVKTENDIDKLISYLGFARTQKNNDYFLALTEMKYLFTGDGEQLKMLKEFNLSQEKLKNSWIKFEKKMSVENSEKILELKHIHQKLFYSCNAKTFNGQKVTANKRFFKTVLGIEFFIAPSSYLATHWEEEKDKDWYKKFVFEMFIKFLPMAARSGMSAIPGQTVIQKIVQDYSAMAISDIFTAVAYSQTMAPSAKELEEKLTLIYKSPKFQEDLQKLVLIYREELKNDQLNKVLRNADGSFKSYDEISNSDEGKELLLEAIALELYQENQGDWIQTGDPGLDRYVYHRIWALQSSVRSILVNLLIFDRLCMGELNPKKAYLESVAIYSINRFIFEPGYQILRKKAINQ